MLKKYESMKEYNGYVDVDGAKVQVKDGVAIYEGQEFYVSKDGLFVIDSNRNLIGTTKDGKFYPVDDEVVQKLRDIGGIEGE